MEEEAEQNRGEPRIGVRTRQDRKEEDAG